MPYIVLCITVSKFGGKYSNICQIYTNLYQIYKLYEFAYGVNECLNGSSYNIGVG